MAAQRNTPDSPGDPGLEVILTHEHADFDAIAAMVGWRRLRPGAWGVLPKRLNHNVSAFLAERGVDLGLRPAEDLPPRPLAHVWLVDCRQARRLPGMGQDTRWTVIDHHPLRRKSSRSSVTYEVERVGATATIICERLQAAAVRPTEIEATLLLLGIYEDTGCLTFGQTTQRDLSAAAWLLGAGADLAAIGRYLRYPLSEAGAGLLGQLLATAEQHDFGGQSVVIATAAARGLDDEIATFARRLMELLEPRAAFVLVELERHIQLVARSTGDGVDAGRVAAALGGGGHCRAAAAVLRGLTLAEARQRLVDTLPDAVTPAVRVRDVMSPAPIVTVRSEQAIGEAHALARRYGHEGYPVVKGNQVVGIVTRHALDRAVDHGMVDQPVARLLSNRLPAVAPQDAVDQVRQVMVEHDVGQVPVVENGRLVGIVTRTDLVRQWSWAGCLERQAARVDLAAVLPAESLQAIEQVAEVAAEQGVHVYLVGGLPRDILLGTPPGPDIDIVVEGDAESLARQIAQRYGGSVRSHQRFGTAKWIGPQLTIDLVSARAEYYTEPTALPKVRRGSLRSDLRRRDFTINAIAIDLDPRRLGQIVDPFRGAADLANRRIRVLHSLSFVDDPTRILRAVRLSHRLDFELETRTAELIPHATELLERLSGARLLAELLQLCREPDPQTTMERLADLNVLKAIQPGLVPGQRTGALLDALPAAWSFWQRLALGARLAAQPSDEHRLLLWLLEQDPTVATAAARRLDMAGRWLRLLAAALQVRHGGSLAAAGELPASAVYAALCRLPAEAVLLGWLVSSDPELRRHLRHYAAELVTVQPLVRAADLVALGIPRGPLYRRILDALRSARLDGRVLSREDELALATKMAQESGEGLEV